MKTKLTEEQLESIAGYIGGDFEIATLLKMKMSHNSEWNEKTAKSLNERIKTCVRLALKD